MKKFLLVMTLVFCSQPSFARMCKVSFESFDLLDIDQNFANQNGFALSDKEEADFRIEITEREILNRGVLGLPGKGRRYKGHILLIDNKKNETIDRALFATSHSTEADLENGEGTCLQSALTREKYRRLSLDLLHGRVCK